MTGAPARVPLPLPDPPLASDAFQLRPWADFDAPALVTAWADEEVARWTGVPADTDLAAAQRWIAGDAHRRSCGAAIDLVIDEDGAVVGEVGLASFDCSSRVAEIGWWVRSDRRGLGLASAAANLMAVWAVEELCIDRVVARCVAANPASGAAARRAGFSLAGSGDDTELWVFDGQGGATLQP